MIVGRNFVDLHTIIKTIQYFFPTIRKIGGRNFSELLSIIKLIQQFFPNVLRDYIQRQWNNLMKFFNRTMQITFDEHTPGLYGESEAYTAIKSYLSSKSAANATRLKGEIGREFSNPLVLALDEREEINDEFLGIKVTWYTGKRVLQGNVITEKKYFTLFFDKKHREIVTEKYVNYVVEQGKALLERRAKRRLYMNSQSQYYGAYWQCAVFEHPASFDTFAMDPDIKEKILNDLITFKQGKEYYNKIGKVWKRGYLFYGPPGTGKSTMISAMSNLLEYDIYDLELTTVKDNAELKRLLINTTSKSIIVIEDIDCTVGFTKKRFDGKKPENTLMQVNNAMMKKHGDNVESKVTLSGLLNIIDGMWSGCAVERIIVFTTNHVDQLDPALIRKGRMDMHIELGYCTFGAFKVFAKNYLDIDSHPLFEKVRELLEVVKMTPADVAENLNPKTAGVAAVFCLEELVSALEMKKIEVDGKLVEKRDERKEDEQEEEKTKKKREEKEEEGKWKKEEEEEDEQEEKWKKKRKKKKKRRN